MTEELSVRRSRAAQDNYATDENLRKRAGLFEYAVATEPQTQLVDLFDWPQDATVLDIGCGSGRWTSIAAQRTESGMVIGLDRSQGMLSALVVRPEPILPLLADGQRLPLRNDSVDVVLATWVLYHLPDKAAALSEICRVLKPSGRLIASTNSAEDPTFDDLFRTCAERVAGHPVKHWIEPLDFTVENGEDMLKPWFERLDQVVNETSYEIPIPEPLVAYAKSLRDPIMAELGEDFEFQAFLSALAAMLSRRLAHEPIRFARRVGFFVGLTPLEESSENTRR
jgi:SAM-dependent methyltransferase